MAAIQAQPWYSASCDAFVSADLYSICTFNPSIICHQFIRVPMPHQEKNSHDHRPRFPTKRKAVGQQTRRIRTEFHGPISAPGREETPDCDRTFSAEARQNSRPVAPVIRISVPISCPDGCPCDEPQPLGILEKMSSCFAT